MKGINLPQLPRSKVKESSVQRWQMVKGMKTTRLEMRVARIFQVALDALPAPPPRFWN
jgi:hypothetical protein